MQPYFEKGGVRLFHGRWQDVAAAIGLEPGSVALTWVDPMWKRVNVRNASRSRGINPKLTGGKRKALAIDWPEPLMEEEQFNPEPFLRFPRLVLWGADCYHDRLPPAPGVWVWDKTGGGRMRDDGYDGQVAFTFGLGRRLEVIHHLWKGCIRESERGNHHLGPFQMPIAVVERCFQLAKLKPGELVFSPFGGSGPEVVVAERMGLQLVICEAVEFYCHNIKRRMTGEASA